MSNKTQLQTNNTALDGYIARINAAKDVAAGLPEAGGGGSGDSVNVISVGLDCGNGTTLSYINESGAISQLSNTSGMYNLPAPRIYVAKNNTYPISYPYCSATNCEILYQSSNCVIIYVKDVGGSYYISVAGYNPDAGGGA